MDEGMRGVQRRLLSFKTSVIGGMVLAFQKEGEAENQELGRQREEKAGF